MRKHNVNIKDWIVYLIASIFVIAACATGGVLIGDSIRATSDLVVGSNSDPSGDRLFSIVSTTKTSNPCPNMSEAQRDAIASPSTGDCVYNTGTNKLNYYDGTSWAPIGSGGGGGGLGLNAYNLIVAAEGNSTFTDDVTGITGSTTAPTHDASNGAFDWDPAGAETLRSDAYTIDPVVRGRNGLLVFLYSGGDTDYSLKILDGSNTEISSDCGDIEFEAVSSGTRWVQCTFIFPSSGSIKWSLESGSDEPTIKGYEVYHGTNFNVDDFNSAGVFSASVAVDGTVSGESADFITGDCALTDTSLFTCTVPGGIFNNLPNCNATNTAASSGVGGETYYVRASSTTTSLVFRGLKSSTTGANNAAFPFDIQCQKSGTDSRQIYTTDQSDYGWTSCDTLTIGATTTAPTKGTTSIDECKYRKIGEDMEFKYTLETSTGGANGSGTYLFPIPNSLSIDTTKQCVDSSEDATCTVGPAGVNLSSGFVKAYDANNLAIIVGNSSNAHQFLDSAFGGLGAAQSYSFTASVPISGWKTSNRAPQLVNSVVSKYEGVQRIDSVNVTDGSATTTLSRETGDWIDGVCTNPSAGNYVCTFVSGHFSDTPNCIATTEAQASARIPTISATSVTVITMNSSASGADGDFTLMCMGPK